MNSRIWRNCFMLVRFSLSLLSRWMMEPMAMVKNVLSWVWNQRLLMLGIRLLISLKALWVVYSLKLILLCNYPTNKLLIITIDPPRIRLFSRRPRLHSRSRYPHHPRFPPPQTHKNLPQIPLQRIPQSRSTNFRHSRILQPNRRKNLPRRVRQYFLIHHQKLQNRHFWLFAPRYAR